MERREFRNVTKVVSTRLLFPPLFVSCHSMRRKEHSYELQMQNTKLESAVGTKSERERERERETCWVIRERGCVCWNTYYPKFPHIAKRIPRVCTEYRAFFLRSFTFLWDLD